MSKSIKRYGPKDESHPTLGKLCAACNRPFEVGDYTAFITLGPGDDRGAQEKARMGLPYDGVVIEVHYACAGGAL